MNCHIRSHSSSGRLGSSLGTAWRNLILKVTSSERLAKSPRRKVLETVAGKLLCLFGLIAVATAFALLIITNLAVAVIRSWWGGVEPVASREEPTPDYLGADLYIGDYDSNGHYIGDCKSSD